MPAIPVTAIDDDGNEVIVSNINANSAKVLATAVWSDPITDIGAQSISLPYPAYTINFNVVPQNLVPIVTQMGRFDINNNLVGNMKPLYEFNKLNSSYTNVLPTGYYCIYIRTLTGPDRYSVRLLLNNSAQQMSLNLEAGDYYISGLINNSVSFNFFGITPTDENLQAMFSVQDNNTTDNIMTVVEIYKNMALFSFEQPE